MTQYGSVPWSLLDARLIRRVGETMIRNLEAEILCPRAHTAGLLKPETIDLAAECDTGRLRISDFKRADFDTARRMITCGAYQGGPDVR